MLVIPGCKANAKNTNIGVKLKKSSFAGAELLKKDCLAIFNLIPPAYKKTPFT